MVAISIHCLQKEEKGVRGKSRTRNVHGSRRMAKQRGGFADASTLGISIVRLLNLVPGGGGLVV